MASRYAAAVFSASVQTSKHPSTAPEASTPSDAFPAAQLAPLAASAVAVVARSIVMLFGTCASVTAPEMSCKSRAASRVASVVASIASSPFMVPTPVSVRVGVEVVPDIVTSFENVTRPLPKVIVVSVPDTSKVQMFAAFVPSDQVVSSMVVESKPPGPVHALPVPVNTPKLSTSTHCAPPPESEEEVISPPLMSPRISMSPNPSRSKILSAPVPGTLPSTDPELMAYPAETICGRGSRVSKLTPTQEAAT